MSGKITLYMHFAILNQSGPNNTSSVGIVNFFFTEKDGVLLHMQKQDFKDNLEKLFGDDPELMKKIKDQKMTYKDVFMIINEYNVRTAGKL